MARLTEEGWMERTERRLPRDRERESAAPGPGLMTIDKVLRVLKEAVLD